MFAKLCGTVDYIGGDYVILDVSGVGYLLYCSGQTITDCILGKKATFWVYTQCREYDISLFGFAGWSEKMWFEALITVQGVGSKVALAVLGHIPLQDLFVAIQTQTTDIFGKVPGIGPKLASRILNELNGKIKGLAEFTDRGAIDRHVTGQRGNLHGNQTKKTESVISALLNLGFSKTEIIPIASEVTLQNPDSSLEEVIVTTLRKLGK